MANVEPNSQQQTSFTLRVAHFRLDASEGRGSLTQNRRNANHVSKLDILVYSGYGVILRDAICFQLKPGFG